MEEIVKEEVAAEKKEKRVRSLEEKILLKEKELEELKKNLAEKQKKEKTKWIGNILKPIKEELEKMYEENREQSLELCTSLLYALEDYKNLSEMVEIDKYVTWTKNKNRIVRVKQEDINEEFTEITEKEIEE